MYPSCTINLQCCEATYGLYSQPSCQCPFTITSPLFTFAESTRPQPATPLFLAVQNTRTVATIASTLTPDGMEGVEYSTVSELFSEDNRQRDSTCIELERDLVLPNKFVRFYESPRTGRPVDKMKKFIKDEPMDSPVDDSNLNTSAIIEPVKSPT